MCQTCFSRKRKHPMNTSVPYTFLSLFPAPETRVFSPLLSRAGPCTPARPTENPRGPTFYSGRLQGESNCPSGSLCVSRKGNLVNACHLQESRMQDAYWPKDPEEANYGQKNDNQRREEDRLTVSWLLAPWCLHQWAESIWEDQTRKRPCCWRPTGSDSHECKNARSVHVQKACQQ